METISKIDDGTSVFTAIDRFINKDLAKNPDLLFRARFLVLMLASGVVVIILIVAIALATQLNIAKNAVIAMILGNLIVIASLLYTLKRMGSYSVCSAAVILLFLANIASVTIVTGGPSSTLHLLSIPCVMAFYLGGYKWGVATAFLSLATTLLMMLLKSTGFQFLEIVSTSEFPFSPAFTLPFNIGIMTILSLVYEVTYTSLKRQRDREHEIYLQLAVTDPLTGLANRRMFDETLVARIETYGKLNPVRPFALCYLDLDRFKPINDEYGHNVGDEVLNSISSRLRLTLRGADFIGRHGGDEFLLLLDSVRNVVDADAMSKRFLQLIEQPIETSAGIMMVGGSFGFALFPEHGTDAAALQKAADEAMYAAKRERCGFKIFEQLP
jgi:diguanylate cyclase (GGDEF)-like protein